MAMFLRDVSDAVQAQLNEFMDKTREDASSYRVELTFTSPTTPDLRVELQRQIDSITITQDFIRNISDKIEVELTLERDEYIILYNMRRNLHCRMEYCKIRTDTTLGVEEQDNRENDTIKTLEFIAVVTKCEDIFKVVPARTITPQNDMTVDENAVRDEQDYNRVPLKMSLELIDEAVFKARKEQMYAILNDVTMDDVLHYVVSFFGLEKCFIVPPSNQFTYTNFIIPPAYGIENIVGFLQNGPGFGIYKDGCCSYIGRWNQDLEHVAWYMFPRYGTPQPHNPIHVLNADPNMLAGVQCTSYKDIAGVHILNSARLESRNWSDVGSENTYTVVNLQDSGAILDGTRKMVEDGKFEMRPVTMDIASVPTGPVNLSHMVRLNREKSRGNIYKVYSDLRPAQGTTINFTWEKAVPWTFTPATKVSLYYDHPTEFKVLDCTCEKVVYTLSKGDKGLYPIFSCTAHVELNCNNMQNDKTIN